ncbi:MAG: NAD(P)H-hydrate epimerase, partial [Nitrososphaerales archaeon]
VAVSSQEMRDIEKAAAKNGVSKLSMMENAGANVANFIQESFENKSMKDNNKFRIVLVAGTGNNGGDVFVAARHLAFWKNNLIISLFLIGEEENIKAFEADVNWKILKKFDQIDRIILDSEQKFSILDQKLSSADVIAVGIFGTGFRGKPKELQRKVIEEINKLEKVDVISVDIPSGLDADTGSYETVVKSDYTITMHAPKTGMLSQSGLQVCGQILVANIGIPL